MADTVNVPVVHEQTASLRYLGDLYQQLQKTRIATENRIRAYKQLNDIGDAPTFFYDVADIFKKLERRTSSEARKELEKLPIWTEWLQYVKGVGPTLAAKILGMIGHISRFDTISKLWRYAGYAVIDGKAERGLGPDNKFHYNRRLKTALYLLGESFIKQRSKYREVYDHYKKLYAEVKHPEWPAWRIHRTAMRKMIKRFLAHLWLVWRELEGLPTRPPYAHEYLGHTSIDDPWKYCEK